LRLPPSNKTGGGKGLVSSAKRGDKQEERGKFKERGAWKVHGTVWNRKEAKPGRSWGGGNGQVVTKRGGAESENSGGVSRAKRIEKKGGKLGDDWLWKENSEQKRGEINFRWGRGGKKGGEGIVSDRKR